MSNVFCATAAAIEVMVRLINLNLSTISSTQILKGCQTVRNFFYLKEVRTKEMKVIQTRSANFANYN